MVPVLATKLVPSIVTIGNTWQCCLVAGRTHSNLLTHNTSILLTVSEPYYTWLYVQIMSRQTIHWDRQTQAGRQTWTCGNTIHRILHTQMYYIKSYPNLFRRKRTLHSLPSTLQEPDALYDWHELNIPHVIWSGSAEYGCVWVSEWVPIVYRIHNP